MSKPLSRRDLMLHQASAAAIVRSLAAPAILRQRESGLIVPERPKLVRGVATHDEMFVYDQATTDSAGAFLLSELERLDPTIHLPLAQVSWPRDIDLRTDVTLGDELSSFTISSYASPGGINPGGKAWIGKNTNAITGVALDIGKVAQPMDLWGMELKYTIPELESAQRLNRPVDTQQYEAIKLKHQMDIDEQVYIGDTTVGAYGLLNSPSVTRYDAAASGTGSSRLWSTKTQQQIMDDVNAALTNAWAASGWTVAPTEIRLDPVNFALLGNRIVSDAGNQSLGAYLTQNNISTQINGQPLRIQPLKWCIGRGNSGSNRMLVYTRDPRFVRYPMTPLARTPLEARAIWQMTYYYCRLGRVEFVYPETIAYVDGI